MNAKRLGTVIAIATVLLVHSGVSAQNAATSASASASRANSLFVTPAPLYSDYYAPRFSSTNAEGLGRGLGAFAEGVGEMNLRNSMAAVNFEEAQRRAIENRRLATENYFAMQRINQEFREAQLHRKGSMIHTGQTTTPARPAANPVDSVAGTIQWPKPLQGREYSTWRKQLESRFARRTGTTAEASAASQRQVQRAAEAMKEELKTHVRQMNPSDYLAAKKFIDRLADAYELRVAQESAQLAAR